MNPFLLAAVVVQAGTGAPSPADSTLLEHVREQYVVIDRPCDGGVTLLCGYGRVVNRFLSLPNASADPLLIDSEFCTTYSARIDGTYCFRARANEPFQVRRIDTESTPVGLEAMVILESILGPDFSSRSPILFPRERVTAAGLTCVSYFINQLLGEPEGSLTDWYLAPPGLYETGLACHTSAGVFWITEPRPVLDLPMYELWDVFRRGTAEYWVVRRTPEEANYLELYRRTADSLELVGEVWLS